MKNFALIWRRWLHRPRHMRAPSKTQATVWQQPTTSTTPWASLTALHLKRSFLPTLSAFTSLRRPLKRIPPHALDYVAVRSNHLHHAHIAAGLRLAANVICENH